MTLLQLLGLFALVRGVCRVNTLTVYHHWTTRLREVCRAVGGAAVLLAMPWEAAAFFVAAELV